MLGDQWTPGSGLPYSFHRAQPDFGQLPVATSPEAFHGSIALVPAATLTDNGEVIAMVGG